MNKTLWIVVVLVAIAAGAWWFERGSVEFIKQTGDASPSPSVSVAPAAGKAKPASSTAAAGKTYTQLVAEFGSNRVQFDQNCAAHPNQMVLKDGTVIMLDNRANEARTISMNGRNYTLGPYGYQIVTLKSSKLPENIGINCNKSVNVGTILLQALISQ